MTQFYTHARTHSFPGDSEVKNPLAKQEMWVQSLGWKDPLEKQMQPTPVVFPGKSHGQEPGRLESMGLQRVGHALVTKQHQQQQNTLHTHTHTVFFIFTSIMAYYRKQFLVLYTGKLFLMMVGRRCIHW